MASSRILSPGNLSLFAHSSSGKRSPISSSFFATIANFLKMCELIKMCLSYNDTTSEAFVKLLPYFLYTLLWIFMHALLSCWTNFMEFVVMCSVINESFSLGIILTCLIIFWNIPSRYDSSLVDHQTFLFY